MRLIFVFCLFSTFLKAQEIDVVREHYNRIAAAYNNLSADDLLRNYSDKAAIFRSNRNNFIQIFNSTDELVKYFNDEFLIVSKEKKKITCTLKIGDVRRLENQLLVSGFQNLEVSSDAGSLSSDAGAFSHVWTLENNEWKLQFDTVIPVASEEFQKGVSRN